MAKRKSGIESRLYSDIVNELSEAKTIDIVITVSRVDSKGHQRDEVRRIKMESSHSMLHCIAAAQIAEAISGNVQAARELINRKDGAVPTVVQEENIPLLEKQSIVVGKNDKGEDVKIEF